MEAPVLAQAGQQVYEDYAPAFAAPQRAGDLSGINVDSAGNFWAINEFADDEALPTDPSNPVADPNNPAADWGTNVVSFALPATLANQFSDPGFETPNVGTGSRSDFVYNPSGAPWTYSSSSGVAGNGSAFTGHNPNAPQGTQVAFLQKTGTISQVVGFTAGTYAISFYATQRAGQASTQTIEVEVDGTVVGTITPSGTSYGVYGTNTFTVTAGTHTVTFIGLDPSGGDNTALIDEVSIQQPATNQFNDPGFETPNVGTGSRSDFVRNPSGVPWLYSSASGVAGNGSGFTGHNPNAPQGTQVAFLQKYGTISQVVNFTAGTYAISFYAAQRAGQASSQTFYVEVDGKVVGAIKPSGTSYGVYGTTAFTMTAGTHVVTFIGLDPSGGDNTALIDQISIQQPATNQFNDPGFETPNVGTGSRSDFVYNPSGAPWLYSSSSGVAGNGSGFTGHNPNAPQGTQVAFLQKYGSISQVVNFTAGTYAISFYAAQRAGQANSQTIEVEVDGKAVGTIKPTGTSYGVYTTNTFTVTAGTHVVTFIGLDPSGGDNTALIDGASIQQPATNQFKDPGFETPNVGTGSRPNFVYDPSGAPWLYSNTSGVAGNGSGFTGHNPNAPQGTQVAFLQDYGTISQVVNFTVGTYAISFYAAQRADQASSQKFEVEVDGKVVGTFTPSSTSYSLFTTSTFMVTAGTHTVEFIGLDPSGGDTTALIDKASI
jgi:hypothetical protein